MAINFPYINAAGTAPLTTKATVTFEGTSAGKYSSLTADDVQREFANIEHAGILLSAIRRIGNTNSTEYVSFTLKGVQNHPGLEGASHLNSINSTVKFYCEKDDLRADLFENGNFAADTQTGDRTIDELLAYWKS